MELRVALAQMPVTDDVQANVEHILRALDFAAAQNADILLTPEGSLSGYTHQFDVRAVADGLAAVTARAKAAGVGLALGTCFVEPDGKCYDQLRLYAPDGRYLGFHSKILLCGTLEDPPEGEINHYVVAPLRTFAFPGVCIGGLICNDMWANPTCTPMPDTHLSQRLSETGARVIFHAVNGGRGGQESELAWQYHESNLRMRARAGRVWIVTVDSCYPLGLPCSTPSGVIAPDGGWAARAEAIGQQYVAHTIRLDEEAAERQ